MYRDQAPSDAQSMPTTPKKIFVRSTDSSSIRASGKRRYQALNNAKLAESSSTFAAGSMYTSDYPSTPPSKRRFYNGDTPPIFPWDSIRNKTTQRTSIGNCLPLRDQLKSPCSSSSRRRGSPRVVTPSRTPKGRACISGRSVVNSKARRTLFINRGVSKNKSEFRQFYTFTPCQLNFKDVNEKPNLMLVPSKTAKHFLEEPVAVVFEEQTQNWYVADRRLGLVVLNRDMTKRVFLLDSAEYENVSALAVLNGGDFIGFLCSAGICVIDAKTYLVKMVYPTNYIVKGNGYLGARLRGLAVTPKGDFLTIDYPRHRIAFISQWTCHIKWVDCVTPHSTDVESVRSSPTYIGICSKQIIIIDYALASFTILRFNNDSLTGLSSQTVDTKSNFAQCRLSAPFVDSCGRIMICNKKEQTVMMYDYDGRYLNTVYVRDGFCRGQSFWINNNNQVAVVDKTSRPHCLQMYSLAADTDFKKRICNQLPLIKQPSPSTPKRDSVVYPYCDPLPRSLSMLQIQTYPQLVPPSYYLPQQPFADASLKYPVERHHEPFMMTRHSVSGPTMVPDQTLIQKEMNGDRFSPISDYKEGSNTIFCNNLETSCNEQNDFVTVSSELKTNTTHVSSSARLSSSNSLTRSETLVRSEMARLRLS